MEAPKLTIQLFNIGSGDHILIKIPIGTGFEYGIIDFYYEKKLGHLELPAITYFRGLLQKNPSEKVTISFLAISHYDNDHIQKTDEFLKFYQEVNKKTERLVIKQIWLGGTKDKDYLLNYVFNQIDCCRSRLEEDELKEFDRLKKDHKSVYADKIEPLIGEWKKRNKAKNLKKKEKFVQGFETLHGNLGSGIRAYSIASTDDDMDDFQKKGIDALVDTFLNLEIVKSQANRNKNSSIIFLEHEKFRWCFGGDALAETWLECLEQMTPENRDLSSTYSIPSDFVKVSHHGSHKSSHPDIISALTEGKEETIFAISAGTKNGHPRSEVLSDIRDICGTTNNVFSTNVCNCCLHETQEGINKIDISDFREIYQDNTTNSEGELSAFLARDLNPPTSSNNFESGNLLAYIFEYDLDSGKVEKMKGVSNNIKGYRACLFEKHKASFLMNFCPTAAEKELKY